MSAATVPMQQATIRQYAKRLQLVTCSRCGAKRDRSVFYGVNLNTRPLLVVPPELFVP